MNIGVSAYVFPSSELLTIYDDIMPRIVLRDAT